MSTVTIPTPTHPTSTPGPSGTALVLVDGQNLGCSLRSKGRRIELRAFVRWLTRYGHPDIHWFQPSATFPVEAFLRAVEHHGASVHRTPYKTLPDGSRKANVDTALVGYGMERLYTDPPNTLVLVSGDGDFADLVSRFLAAGIRVIIIADPRARARELEVLVRPEDVIDLPVVLSATSMGVSACTRR